MKKHNCFLFVLAILFMTACVGPIKIPSKYVQKATPGFQSPPPGKSLVIIHRPRNRKSHGLYTGVWDSRNFIADLGNGHSVAYVCDPGQHYFINRSVERTGVVEAQLLPDKIYTIWVKSVSGAFINSFLILPTNPGNIAWSKVVRCEKENLWVERSSQAAEYETWAQSEIDLILKDFVGGSKSHRVSHLLPGEHR